MNNPSLWERLEAFEIGNAQAQLTFAKRLARENRWSLDYSNRVIREYKRFLYLMVEAGHHVTPSEAVDQAWHLHLAYTRSYWQELCRDLLGRELHHGPTEGGEAEGAKYADWYQRTLDSYEAQFGEAPPQDIWPPVSERFDSRLQWVDLNRKFVLPKPGKTALTASGVLVLSTLLYGCSKDEAQLLFFLGAIFALVIFVLAMAVIKGGKGGGGNGGGWFGCGGGGDGGCGGGGCGGGGCGS